MFINNAIVMELIILVAFKQRVFAKSVTIDSIQSDFIPFPIYIFQILRY